MEPVPEHRALLGVDVVGSARNPGHHLNAVHTIVEESLSEALRISGISRSEALSWESTGDGALVMLPSAHLGAVLDSTDRLDTILGARNRWQKPEVRLRIAVEVGPVGDEPGLYAAKITHSRLLNAEAFKELFARCRQENSEDSVHSALIVSDHVLRTAFSGDHTTLVHRGDFAPLSVSDKEYADTAWVRVPRVDSRSLTSLGKRAPAQAADPDQQVRVVNQVNGSMNGIQAGTVNGGITYGSGPR